MEETLTEGSIRQERPHALACSLITRSSHNPCLFLPRLLNIPTYLDEAPFQTRRARICFQSYLAIAHCACERGLPHSIATSWRPTYDNAPASSPIEVTVGYNRRRKNFPDLVLATEARQGRESRMMMSILGFHRNTLAQIRCRRL